MNCLLCGKELSKAVKCPLKGSICARCCFYISAGNSEFIANIKKDGKLTKEEILSQCGSCTPINEKV